jgi:cell wall-associated NlpC family hydrolase
MLLKIVGISIPRDTGLQIKTDWLEEIPFADTLPGDLIFFSKDNCINHVAFTTGDGKIIHCSGEVKLESIIEGEPGFNSKLAKLDHTFTSISKMVNS